MGPLDLTRQVGHGNEFLATGREIAQADVPVAQLIAHDHGEMGAITDGRLELFAELAVTELGASRQPGRPQVRGDAQARRAVIRIDADHDRGWR